MINEKQINKILEDHEKRISTLEGKTKVQKKINTSAWYRPNSTIERIIILIQEEFFKKTRKIGDIVCELKTKDYHLESPDLTLPLRRIVRKGLLKKTKNFSDGSKSKVWLYIENKE
ncbi:MAG: hypothetical protein HY607_04900 [Planctomycetes bacterium]|nr:hypothetical protein [Planctomycetota bacterium]